MAERPSQSEDVPQGEAHSEVTGEQGVPEADDLAQASAGDDNAQAESLVDGDAISEDDINTLLNAAGGVVPTAAGDASNYFADATANSKPDSDREERPPETQPFDYPELGDDAQAAIDPKRVTMLNDVNLRVRLQLGQARMYLEDVLKLSEGSVVELDKLAGDPVDVLVNDRLIARGEVLALNDVFCVRICEVLSNDPHRITV